MLLREMPLSLPMACVALGIGFFSLPGVAEVVPNPLESRLLTERLTEAIVIISLMGAGLKLDRPLAWRSWGVTWGLLGIAMPFTIAGIALLGWGLLGLGLASALLLGAALAPTDPVLASDVQVGPPGSGEEDETRFALTAEAGLNDGLAFPFVNLAIAVALVGHTGEPWFLDWVLVDVAWKLAAGCGMGWLTGYVLGFLLFRIPNRARLAESRDGFVALGATFLSYGATELVHGYGFIAAFVSALALRRAERRHHFHQTLHSFTEQTERLLMMVLLVLFGAAIAEGSLREAMSWPIALFALLTLFVVRPLCGWIGLSGQGVPLEERLAISFFGIRGIGSFYYLAFAMGVAEFEDPRVLWSATGLVVLVSIVLHGTTVTPVMRYLDARGNERGDRHAAARRGGISAPNGTALVADRGNGVQTSQDKNKAHLKS
jgi:NhaP-type Na+/H+ or K+/H+ antiporter